MDSFTLLNECGMLRLDKTKVGDKYMCFNFIISFFYKKSLK